MGCFFFFAVVEWINLEIRICAMLVCMERALFSDESDDYIWIEKYESQRGKKIKKENWWRMSEW